MPRIEDITPDVGPTEDELAGEIELYQRWVDEEARKHEQRMQRAGWRKYLSTPQGGQAA